ncbi:dTMP kinase [Porticoccus sp. W117]|uniref:dTMP kinase n=1 Tax=Porticoccus sp. W117 TaxID=3054777 RepID=UPI002592AEAB|nr:dTMP kinase [Porticoccus sp. W117]MDM3872265.1 dTMP kinase [Porticoccus sp. W117]
MRGKFITLEGTEGVGKTTNMAFIQQWLTDQCIDFVTTREPGGTPLAEDIRHLLLTHRDEAVDETAELLLMFAARSQHIAQVIEPALAAGKWVLCDRFTDATYAYQGGGRGQSTEHIAQLEQLVQGDLRPDLTLLLDLPVDVGLQRARKRSDPDRFEAERQQFFTRVRDAYLERARQQPKRCQVVDASLPLEQVQGQIDTALQQFIAEANHD